MKNAKSQGCWKCNSRGETVEGRVRMSAPLVCDRCDGSGYVLYDGHRLNPLPAEKLDPPQQNWRNRS